MLKEGKEGRSILRSITCSLATLLITSSPLLIEHIKLRDQNFNSINPLMADGNKMATHT